MADFFSEPKEEKPMDEPQETQVSDKIKVGGVEYDQGELERLVGLGKIGAEAEDKYKTRIDRVWPEFTKGQQKLQELEARLTQREQAEIAARQAKGEELSPDQLREVARKQGKELGIMFQEDFDQMYVQRRAAERLLEDVDVLVSQTAEKGQPKTTREDLLKHMQETGIKNPEKAYKDMFEEELEKWRTEQVEKARPSGFTTAFQSTAGAKQPAPVKITKENLGQLVSEALSGGQGV